MALLPTLTIRGLVAIAKEETREELTYFEICCPKTFPRQRSEALLTTQCGSLMHR